MARACRIKHGWMGQSSTERPRLDDQLLALDNDAPKPAIRIDLFRPPIGDAAAGGSMALGDGRRVGSGKRREEEADNTPRDTME